MKDLVNLQQAIYKTIEDIELWQEVLLLFCKLTGAKKGIITLRDRTTAELVIPTDVESDLSSPLLYGFSNEEIGGYIEHYIAHDPWTEIEKLYHPNSPIALSKYVKYKHIVTSHFWEWLEPQDVNDTVVLDIGASYPNWVAMNLYYDGQNPAIKRKILRYTTMLQSTMQEAWALGQKVRAAQLEPERLGYFLDQQPDACVLLSADEKVILANKKAQQLFKAQDTVISCEHEAIVIPNKKLKKQYENMFRLIKDASSTQFQEPIDIQSGDFTLTLTLVEKAEDQVGVDKAARLLTIKRSSITLACIWDTPGLTKRERQLVEFIAQGGRVVDFSNSFSLSKSTSHFHWSNVKKKLGVLDRSEIVTRHQLYLQEM
ncbi:MAG: LuxR C-terminal-related transcriptional regulator [Oceanospirillaceae bacterium]